MVEKTYRALTQVDGLSVAEFNRTYRGRRPVLFTEPTGAWRGTVDWNNAYLREISYSHPVKIRPARSSHLAATRVTQYVPMRDYIDLMEKHDAGVAEGAISPSTFPPYLHDTPLLKYAPQLVADLGSFPTDYLPGWYREIWPQLALFFVGPTNGLTPLHFDSCATHNLFFQLKGTKRFIIISAKSGSCCYRTNWHWSAVNAEAPDYTKYPKFADADVVECTIGPGQILYMPPNTWHQVRIIESSISFNIDWHTPGSALLGMAAILAGMPPRNALFYNMPQAVGLITGRKPQWIARLMQLHLDYVD